MNIPDNNPTAMPDKWAMFPMLSGINNPIKSPATQSIPAINSGKGTPKAQTNMKGLMIINAPITPNIAPDAPKLEL